MTVKELIQFVLNNQLDMDIEIKVIRHGSARPSSLLIRDPRGNIKKRYLEMAAKVKS